MIGVVPSVFSFESCLILYIMHLPVYKWNFSLNHAIYMFFILHLFCEIQINITTKLPCNSAACKFIYTIPPAICSHKRSTVSLIFLTCWFFSTFVVIFPINWQPAQLPLWLFQSLLVKVASNIVHRKLWRLHNRCWFDY